MTELSFAVAVFNATVFYVPYIVAYFLYADEWSKDYVMANLRGLVTCIPGILKRYVRRTALSLAFVWSLYFAAVWIGADPAIVIGVGIGAALASCLVCTFDFWENPGLCAAHLVIFIGSFVVTLLCQEKLSIYLGQCYGVMMVFYLVKFTFYAGREAVIWVQR